MSGPLVVSEEVAAAVRGIRPVVALESTILAHGLPRPDNRRVADEIESAVRGHGAVPATIAVLDGAVRVGLTGTQLDRLCTADLAGVCAARLLCPFPPRRREAPVGVRGVPALPH